jgi:lipid-binding SYLF domain-containing protein
MMTIRRAFCVALIAAAASVLWAPSHAEASGANINADVRATLDHFFARMPGARELANKAAGVLVFPTVVKAGFGIGGEYGEGAMLVAERPVGYYNLCRPRSAFNSAPRRAPSSSCS